MARIRTIKYDIWEDEKFGPFSPDTKLTWFGLVTQADDAGRLRYTARTLRCKLFPYDDEFDDEMMRTCIREIHDAGMIQIYDVNDNTYIQILNWLKHQKISHPAQSYIPDPPDSGVF